MTENAMKDNLSDEEMQRVKIKSFVWGDQDDQIFALGKKYDLILGADLVYDLTDHPEYLVNLRDSIIQMLATNPSSCVAYLAYEQRRSDLAPFFSTFSGCHCKQVATPQLLHAFKTAKVRVHEIRLMQ